MTSNGAFKHLFDLGLNGELEQINAYFRADPGFFLGGGAHVSCSTSTPINHIVFFFFAEYQLY